MGQSHLGLTDIILWKVTGTSGWLWFFFQIIFNVEIANYLPLMGFLLQAAHAGILLNIIILLCRFFAVDYVDQYPQLFRTLTFLLCLKFLYMHVSRHTKNVRLTCFLHSISLKWHLYSFSLITNSSTNKFSVSVHLRLQVSIWHLLMWKRQKTAF